MTSTAPELPPPSAERIGAGLASAIICGDTDLVASYLAAFSTGFIVTGLTSAVFTLGAALSGFTGNLPSAIGDDLVARALQL